MYETSSWRYGQLQKALYSVVNTALYGFSNIDSELIDGYSGGILIVKLLHILGELLESASGVHNRRGLFGNLGARANILAVKR